MEVERRRALLLEGTLAASILGDFNTNGSAGSSATGGLKKEMATCGDALRRVG
jgi:hypothetical protein